MEFDGAMILDATASGVAMSEIVAYYTDDPTQTVIARMTEQGRTNMLTLMDLAWNDDITFTLNGPESGNFDLRIVCESDSPTSSPSRNPSPSPTSAPTPSPSRNPTPAPSSAPTPSPS